MLLKSPKRMENPAKSRQSHTATAGQGLNNSYLVGHTPQLTESLLDIMIA